MIRVVSDTDECRALWARFATGERLWDVWDVIWAYHDPDRYALEFHAVEVAGQAVGLVPLVRDLKDGSHEMLGGCYPDNRPLWVAPEHFPELFEALPEPAMLFDLNDADARAILAAHPQFEPNFSEVDLRYFLVPARFGYDFNNHIATFSSEKRKGFQYDLRKIRERGPEIRWSEDDEAELFIDLCNRNFGAESDYASEAGANEVRRAVRALQELGMLRTVTVSLDGVKQAVGLSAEYRGTLVALYSASNNEIKNTGKLLNVETIQEAGRRRLEEVNYMTGMAWKAAWKMFSEPCRTFRKPPRPAVPAENATSA